MTFRFSASQAIAGLLLCLCVFVSQTHAFQLQVNDRLVDLPLLAIPVTPGEWLTVEVVGSRPSPVSMWLNDEPVTHQGNVWRWRVPGQGPDLYRLSVSDGIDERVVKLLVKRPRSEVRNGQLNGYRIGAYPEQPLNGLDIYLPPRGFVEVTEANRNLRISPHYRLGDFVAKQPGDYPKYLVVRPELLMKLETVQAALVEAGVPITRFQILSGYRTPFYNRAIGNGQYSRHVWGGAADIFIDESGDGQMDDLNGDGQICIEDARWLAAFVDELSRGGKLGDNVGGIGIYGPRPWRGPFVHVDVRGFHARW